MLLSLHNILPYLLKDRTSKQKINKESEDLNNTIDQMDKANMKEYSTHQQQNMDFSHVHIKFSTVNHVVGKKKVFTNLRINHTKHLFLPHLNKN